MQREAHEKGGEMPVVPTQYVMSTRRARRSSDANRAVETLLARGYPSSLEGEEIGRCWGPGWGLADEPVRLAGSRAKRGMREERSRIL